jgi:5-methylcytosine-specific restriction endonuclease McrA
VKQRRPRHRLGESKTTRIREDYRRIQPLCERCLKLDPPRVRLWEELDHRIALANGGDDFDVDPSQRQGLCKPCHVEKTREDLGRRLIGGADENGLPTNPLHHWNVKTT